MCMSSQYFAAICTDYWFSIVVLSERIVDKVKMCEIRSEIYGASDHCPIVMEIDSGIFDTNNSSAGSSSST